MALQDNVSSNITPSSQCAHLKAKQFPSFHHKLPWLDLRLNMIGQVHAATKQTSKGKELSANNGIKNYEALNQSMSKGSHSSFQSANQNTLALNNDQFSRLHLIQ